MIRPKRSPGPPPDVRNALIAHFWEGFALVAGKAIRDAASWVTRDLEIAKQVGAVLYAEVLEETKARWIAQMKACPYCDGDPVTHEVIETW
jgi:hypothetical protein